MFNIVDSFRQAMHSSGIQYYGELIPDGKLHRFHIEGQKRGSKNGAYVLHNDHYPAGYFQDFKSGICHTWKKGQKNFPIKNYAYKKQIEEAKHQRALEQNYKHENAATKAMYLWRRTKPAFNHSYLKKKDIKSHGARQLNDALVIPIWSESDL